MYLQLNPNNCNDIYDNLLGTAKKKNNKTLECVLDIYKGTILFYMNRNDSAIVFFDKAILSANKLQNQQLLSTAKIRRLFVIGKGNDSKIMLGLMTDEYDVAKKHKDTLNMIYSLNGIAQYHENLDETKGCIDSYMQAIALAQSNKNEFEYGFLLNNLGLLKLQLKAPEEGYADFIKGIKIAKKLNNIRLEITLRENIGYYYMVVDSLELAEKEFQSTYKLASKLKYAYLAFNSLLNLGAVEQNKKNFSKSDSLMRSALTLAQRDELYYAISPIYLNFAQVALSKKEYNIVWPMLDSAMVYSKFTSRNAIQEIVLEIKYKFFKQKKNFEQSLIYYKKLIDFRDSIDKNGHVQIITELQLKYDVEKKEKQRVNDKITYEKKISKEKLRAAGLRQKIAIGIIVVIFLISGLIIFYAKEKSRRESEFSSALINKLEEDRGRIARDLHDGLGQSLIILKNKFDKLGMKPSDLTEQINADFTETIEEVRCISRSLIPPELRRLGLLKSLRKMMFDLENSTPIIISSDLELLNEIKLDVTQEILIYRIVQELTNNTIKHSGATSLKLEFIKISGGIMILYQDNGKGFDFEKLGATENSIGIRSINQRLKFLNGTIKFEKKTKGFKAIIKIKLK